MRGHVRKISLNISIQISSCLHSFSRCKESIIFAGASISCKFMYHSYQIFAILQAIVNDVAVKSVCYKIPLCIINDSQ